MTLTDAEIRAAKPRSKPYKLSDGGWLYLLVTPSGSKLWRMSYRFGGKEKTLALGAYPQLSLKDARTKRDEAKALQAAGIDPGEEKRQAKLAQAVATATTFELVAADYLDKLKRENRAQTTLDKIEWLLSLVLPKLGGRPISQISAAEILAILKPVEARGNLETAKRLRGTVGAVFRYAIATARADSDPTAALKGAISAPKVTHRAAITDPVKLGAYLRALDAFDGQPETVAALKLLPLVFTRPGELRLAGWSEFDLDAGIWTIPAGRTKMRREHQVPLPRQALDILAKLKELTGRGRLVFPGIRSRERPISENTLNASMRRMGFMQDEVTAHGFRATASTLLNESGKFAIDAI
ncbi:MAG: integrase arm-type DNA-binding domain-containing protein, partial [Alphaproteobacteria bacterium]|nr:integrase arm-type DNA-binding domain-containing protein [Alphaproteobacteria bacterium]